MELYDIGTFILGLVFSFFAFAIEYYLFWGIGFVFIFSYYQHKKWISNDCLEKDEKFELEILAKRRYFIITYFIFGIFYAKYIHNYWLLFSIASGLFFHLYALTVRVEYLSARLDKIENDNSST